MTEWKVLRAERERRQVRAAEAALVADWRRRHPEATCADATVLALLTIESVGRRLEVLP